MKTLIFGTLFTLSIAAFSPVAYGHPATGKFPHIDGGIAFPNTRIGTVGRHSFNLEIPQQGNVPSQLTIEVPDGLRVGKTITVSNQAGQKVETNASVNGNKVVLDFPQPVVLGTTLRINLKNVLVTGFSNGWAYPLSGKFAGLNGDIPLGTVLIQNRQRT